MAEVSETTADDKTDVQEDEGDKASVEIEEKVAGLINTEMNPPSTGLWNDPPPPGIEDEKYVDKNDKQHNVDPYIKSPHYLDYESHKHRESGRHGHRRRSRSRSYDRYRSRTRSRDRDKKRRSRSKRSRGHHRHRSVSRSRSPSHDRNRRHKEKKRRRRSRSRRHSRSRSRSRSRNHKRQYSKISRKSRTYSHSPTSDKNEYSENENNKDEDKFDEEEAESANQNAFKNDGSFLELFRKMQEEQEQQKAEAQKAEASASEVKVPTYGKRRGGRVLKTGVVVKSKMEEENDGVEPQDPWSIYLKEVKRYKEACCDDDSKTRPLVK